MALSAVTLAAEAWVYYWLAGPVPLGNYSLVLWSATGAWWLWWNLWSVMTSAAGKFCLFTSMATIVIVVVSVLTGLLYGSVSGAFGDSLRHPVRSGLVLTALFPLVCDRGLAGSVLSQIIVISVASATVSIGQLSGLLDDFDQWRISVLPRISSNDLIYFMESRERYSGLALNPVDAGYHFISGIGASCFVLILSPKRRWWIIVPCAVLVLWAACLTKSRSLLVGLALAGLVSVISVAILGSRLRWVVLFVGVGALSFLLALLASEARWERAFAVGDRRFALFLQGLEVAWRYPLGIGGVEYAGVVDSSIGSWTPGYDPSHIADPHCYPLTLGAYFGWHAMFLALGMIVYVAWAAIRGIRSGPRVVGIATLAWLALWSGHMLFHNAGWLFGDRHNLVVAVIALTLLSSRRESRTPALIEDSAGDPTNGPVDSGDGDACVGNGLTG